ncbi:MAG: lanthionine synthetase LanC family protein [Roseimicrobium sp.]
MNELNLSTAADSVFKFIRRTAEHDGSRCRWQTADYENKLQYDISLFNGVGGIPLFLADYARLRGNEEAHELALGALEWCADPTHAGHVRGLHLGKAGPAFAAISMDAQEHSPAISALCDLVTGSILREDPGPVTDMLGGASSNGFYLLTEWRKQGDPRLLEGAIRCGEWLLLQLTRDELGCHCLMRPGNDPRNRPFSGFAHGISGVAFYFSILYQATSEAIWKKAALEIFDTLIPDAQPVHEGWNWSPLLGDKTLPRCQWSHGSAGIGLAFLAAAQIIDEPRLMHAALMAGEATYGYGDFRKNATQCIGLAGGGELLLELARVTGESRWLERAREFGEGILAYHVTTPEGHDAWPTDAEPTVYTADFMYGAAGIGHFLLRLETQGALPMPLIGDLSKA